MNKITYYYTDKIQSSMQEYLDKLKEFYQVETIEWNETEKENANKEN
jgi:hypothetical protein